MLPQGNIGDLVSCDSTATYAFVPTGDYMYHRVVTLVRFVQLYQLKVQPNVLQREKLSLYIC